jgi:hypothetical protein
VGDDGMQGAVFLFGQDQYHGSASLDLGVVRTLHFPREVFLDIKQPRQLSVGVESLREAI